MNAAPGPVMVGHRYYGTIVQTMLGFVFLSAQTTLGRKAHATPEACLPRSVRAALKQHAKETE